MMAALYATESWVMEVWKKIQATEINFLRSVNDCGRMKHDMKLYEKNWELSHEMKKKWKCR
jgi:hypothetical protein